ncbi:MAG: peptidase [Bacteroidetes bacterium]|nr:peptidase [Bacteroidota bacterium]
MKKLQFLSISMLAILLVAGCGQQQKKEAEVIKTGDHKVVSERLAMYADVDIDVDMSMLTDRQRQLVAKLIEAGRLVDEIFWMQSSHDAIAVRDSLASLQDPAEKDFYKYVRINYGPYDRIFEGERFVGEGPARKPAGAGLYPPDMTKEEFEAWVSAHPEQKEAMESPYTVVVREGDKLVAMPYHEFYPQAAKIAELLVQASELADNPSLKQYLLLRAGAIADDDYYESDMAWMDLKDNAIDVVIGPIENYEDGLFNYKTAFECAVVVKDPIGTKELQMYKQHIDSFEQALPIDAKYKRKSAGSGNVLEVVNIVYFGGDFQAGIKTIAASLPNDPKVTEKKGGKKQMYKNMMEAKFEKIVMPIAERVLEPALHEFVDKRAFTSFVTLHEVSHTLGRPYVYGNDKLSVRKAMKERYSTIEECKADILGLYNNKLLRAENAIDDNKQMRTIVTYVAGLFRSLRFGVEEAHGQANLMQLNWFLEKGSLIKHPDGTYGINFDNFMDIAGELARAVLTVEIEGDYDGAGELIEKHGKMTPEIDAVIKKLVDIPRDLNTSYTAAR